MWQLIPIPLIAFFALCIHADPWAEMRREFYITGRREGLTDDQIQECIRYTILVNRQAGWIGPGRRKR